jgi:tetratricopeptide (TPR) repeat protein
MGFLAQPNVGGQRLLVIDNVDDPDLDLDPFLPRWASGTVIVTSRSISRGQLDPSTHLKLDVMTLEESVELLIRGCGRPWPPSESDIQAATSLAEALGHHPIALTQAVSYMHNTGISTETYISRLTSSRELVLSNPARSQVDMRYKTAFAAFDASYEILPSNAQKLLHLLSYFHWKNFPLKLIIVAAENGFLTDHHNYLARGDEFRFGVQCLCDIFCPLGRWDPFELDKMIADLRDHSLISIVSTGDSELASMHPLVHEWARSRRPEDATHFQAAAIRLLCCGAIRSGYFMTRYLFVHAQALSAAWGNLHVNDAAAFSRLLRQSGTYSEATALMEVAHQTLEHKLGFKHLNTLLASADLADNYRQLGRLDKTESLDEQVWRYRKELLGDDHLDTIHASAHLAYTYGKLGRHAEAERLQVQVVAQRKQLLGDDHLETIRASANLAQTYDYLGQHTKAAGLAIDVTERRRRLLGSEHPDTILACANLGSIYRNLGRYEEARELEIDVLRRRTILWCERHPETLHAMLSLARTYYMVQRKSEALKLAQRANDIALASLGESHPLYTEISAFLALYTCT